MELDQNVAANIFTGALSFSGALILLRLLMRYQATFVTTAQDRIKEQDDRIDGLEAALAKQRRDFELYMAEKQAEWESRFASRERSWTDRLAEKEREIEQLRVELRSTRVELANAQDEITTLRRRLAAVAPPKQEGPT